MVLTGLENALTGNALKMHSSEETCSAEKGSGSTKINSAWSAMRIDRYSGLGNELNLILVEIDI